MKDERVKIVFFRQSKTGNRIGTSHRFAQTCASALLAVIAVDDVLADEFVYFCYGWI